ncbi:hypothetical protein BDC45DRAFT_32506 [Circinella umbellata]|nr:hypothetical protein BDC45DRAFT_32506 [Circinella umbellata]
MQYRRLPTDENNVEDPLRPPDYEPTNNNNSHFNSQQEQHQLINNNDKDNNNNITTFSPPPSFRSTSPVQSQQRVDLEETFDESIDDSTAESQRLLSPWQQEENTFISIPNNPSASSSSSSSSNAAATSQPATLPVPTDGVFSNMSAKPESERDKLDETPPVSKI